MCREASGDSRNIWKSLRWWAPLSSESSLHPCHGFTPVLVLSPSNVSPWTVAHQAPLSMGFFSGRNTGVDCLSTSLGSPQPRDQTHISCISCTAGRFFTAEPSWVLGFPGGSAGKQSACYVGEQGSIPGLGRSSGEGNGNPLQYSCLEKSMDRRAWWATDHGVTKSWTQLRD